MARREKRGKSKSSAGFNQKAGEDFLKQNAQKEGVYVSSSGLQWKIIEATEGEKPDEYSKVLIHQRVLLLNGTLLEDTYRKNKPDEVNIEELIEGLQEALQMMGKGSRYKFWVPAELAWGKKGTSHKIPPNAVLSFDIRLVDVVS